MFRLTIQRMAFIGVVSLVAVGGSSAQTINVPGVGADGQLDLTTCNGDHVIDLGEAIDGSWDDADDRPLRDPERPLDGGVGVYDQDKWAVVYDYTSVFIPSGCRVLFENHPANPPVVWLVQGDVTIDGELNLNGEAGTGDERTLSTPGPGGFRGGRADLGSQPGSSGLGPGGGVYGSDYGGGGEYAGGAGGDGSHDVYGNPRILPLIGGSGGGGDERLSEASGGAAGGAVLCAADGTISVGAEGHVVAKGGAGTSQGSAGSGGAIRLLAHTIAVDGVIRADRNVNWRGGEGRVRLEGFDLSAVEGQIAPDYTYQTLSEGEDAVLWLEDLPAEDPKPRAWIAEVAGQDATTKDPRASFGPGQADLNIANPTQDQIVVVIKTEDVPTPAGTDPWTVLLRATTRTGGAHQEVEASFISTDDVTGISTWHAVIALKNGTSALQVRAYKP